MTGSSQSSFLGRLVRASTAGWNWLLLMEWESGDETPQGFSLAWIDGWDSLVIQPGVGGTPVENQSARCLATHVGNRLQSLWSTGRASRSIGRSADETGSPFAPGRAAFVPGDRSRAAGKIREESCVTKRRIDLNPNAASSAAARDRSMSRAAAPTSRQPARRQVVLEVLLRPMSLRTALAVFFSSVLRTPLGPAENAPATSTGSTTGVPSSIPSGSCRFALVNLPLIPDPSRGIPGRPGRSDGGYPQTWLSSVASRNAFATASSRIASLRCLFAWPTSISRPGFERDQLPLLEFREMRLLFEERNHEIVLIRRLRCLCPPNGVLRKLLVHIPMPSGPP